MAGNMEELQWSHRLHSDDHRFSFIMKKTLTASDVDPQQNRLLIPQTDAHNKLGPLLYDNERAHRTSVTVVTKNGWHFWPKLTTATWQTGSTVINGTEYRKLVECSGFQVGDVVRMWAYRSGDKLCFAIDKASAQEHPAG